MLVQIYIHHKKKHCTNLRACGGSLVADRPIYLSSQLWLKNSRILLVTSRTFLHSHKQHTQTQSQDSFINVRVVYSSWFLLLNHKHFYSCQTDEPHMHTNLHWVPDSVFTPAISQLVSPDGLCCQAYWCALFGYTEWLTGIVECIRTLVSSPTGISPFKVMCSFRPPLFP